MSLVKARPLDGETVSSKDFSTYTGGKGGNQSIAFSRISEKNTYIIACSGDDSFGEKLKNEIKSNNIKCKYIYRIQKKSSGIASITIDYNGENSIILSEGANNFFLKKHIYNALDFIKKSNIVALQLEIPLETVYYTINLSYKLKKIIILNPAPVKNLRKSFLKKIDYLIPNEIEIQKIAGLKNDIFLKNNIISYLSKKIKNSIYNMYCLSENTPNILITLGKKGVYMILKSYREHHISAKPIIPLDTTAAGDTFIGSFISSLYQGYNNHNSIEIGQRASSICIKQKGAQSSFPYNYEL